MADHYQTIHPKGAYPLPIGIVGPSTKPPPNQAHAVIDRLAALNEAFRCLRLDFHDRLMAAREPFGVSTPPEADQQAAQTASRGPLMDQIEQLEAQAQAMTMTVSGFRDLFG